MKMKKLKNSLPLLIILSLIVTALNLSPVAASPGATVRVRFPNETSSSIDEYFPENYYYPGSPADMFPVFINIEGVDDLFGFEFKLKYKTDVLTANDTIVGEFFGEEYQKYKSEINDDLGYVWLAITQDTGEAGVSGTGTLAIIVFSVDASGGSCLSLSDTSKHAGYFQNDVMLVDSAEQLIDFQVIDGHFVNSPVHDVTITSVTPSAASVIKGQTVNVKVVARNEGYYTESFDVTVYADAIEIGTQSVTDLERGSRADLTFTWDTTDVELGEYIISATAATVPDEIDTTDNTFTLAWDFSGKTYVDITIKVIDYPVATFTYSPADPFVFEEMTFDASESTPNGGEIINYLWKWGNGITGSGDVTTYIYPASGTYNVTLIITDSEGLTDTTSQEITVGIPSCKFSSWEMKVNNAAGEGKGHKTNVGNENLLEACVMNTEATRDIYVQVVFKVTDASGATVVTFKAYPSEWVPFEAVPAGKTTTVDATWVTMKPGDYYITAYLYNQDLSETIKLKVLSA